MITSTANGAFWCAFGIAIQDYLIAGPNGVGAFLGGIQIVLYVLFPHGDGGDADNGDNDTATVQPLKKRRRLTRISLWTKKTLCRNPVLEIMYCRGP
jgi:hypothetical protein